MHWFWRALIAVGVGNLVGIISFEVVFYGLYGWLRSVYGPFDDWPWMGFILFTLVTVPALYMYALLPRAGGLERPPAETRCRRCGYILRGISEPRCPECGEHI